MKALNLNADKQTRATTIAFFTADGVEVYKGAWNAEYLLRSDGSLWKRYHNNRYFWVKENAPQWYKDLTCDSCGGEGEYTSFVAGVGVVDEPCKICHGKGWVL